MFSTALYELCLAFRFDILTEGRGISLCGMFIYSSEIIPIPCNNLLITYNAVLQSSLNNLRFCLGISKMV